MAANCSELLTPSVPCLKSQKALAGVIQIKKKKKNVPKNAWYSYARLYKNSVVQKISKSSLPLVTTSRNTIFVQLVQLSQCDIEDVGLYVQSVWTRQGLFRLYYSCTGFSVQQQYCL